MVMRELASGEAEACRQKAVDKVDTLWKKLDGKTDCQKFTALNEAFTKIADCAQRASENLDPDKFYARGNDRLDPDQLANLMKCAVTGHHQMELIKDRMAELKNDRGECLAQVNGTSEMFAMVAHKISMEASHLEINNIFMATGVAPQTCPVRLERPILVAKLAVMMSHVISAFFMFEDFVAV